MPSPSPIRIATRGSALALAQAYSVLQQCQSALPQWRFEIKIIKTTGDKLQTASLAASDLPKGLFTKELEASLLSKAADLAVHSLKDLPTELPAGLHLGAVGRRADPRDVLVYRAASTALSQSSPPNRPPLAGRGFPAHLLPADLPLNAVVGTGSTRRSAQLIELRPDLQVVALRGNVPTRLRKVASQPHLDAIVLAAAGLARLQFEIQPDGQLVRNERPGPGPAETRPDLPPGLLATPLSPEIIIPCVGQAAIGIEVRAGDPRLNQICQVLDHPTTHLCVTAERAFLHAMGGGCQLAVAAYGEIAGDQLRLRSVSYLGGRVRRAEISGAPAQAANLGAELAARLKGI